MLHCATEEESECHPYYSERNRSFSCPPSLGHEHFGDDRASLKINDGYKSIPEHINEGLDLTTDGINAAFHLPTSDQSPRRTCASGEDETRLTSQSNHSDLPECVRIPGPVQDIL